ncbi:hypothetical protein [Thiohalorhabdus sp.]|uniref:hypothetical protein n=1 Tax=Thiohalorhabdus sp. TaxID=3094134 RepID=UPI002FC3762F
MTSRKLWAILLGSAPTLAAGAEGDAPEPSSPRLGFHLGLEAFTWSEQASNPSREILEEEGPRFTGAVTFDNYLRSAEGPVYALEARGYAGEMDYDGETQGGVPLRTEVSYKGALGEGQVGYRFLPDWARYSFDAMAGLGGEYWSRDIQDGFAANGTPVQGVEEQYTVVYAKAGLGVADLTFEEWYGRLEAGVRYPLDVHEEIDAFNAELSPNPEPNFYAAYELSKVTSTGTQVGVTLYYDSYRFDPSPVSSSSIGAILQPESDMDVIGLRLGVFL